MSWGDPQPSTGTRSSSRRSFVVVCLLTLFAASFVASWAWSSAGVSGFSNARADAASDAEVPRQGRGGVDGSAVTAAATAVTRLLGPSVTLVSAFNGTVRRRELSADGSRSRWSQDTPELPSPIVVGGLGGSGTRAMAAALFHLGCAYPAVRTNAELDCMPVGQLPYTGTWPLSFSRNDSLGSAEDGGTNCLMMEAGAAYANPSTAMVSSGGPQGICWYWKNPRSWAALPAMRTWLIAGHTFVLVVRDPRDIALTTNHRQLGKFGPALCADVQDRYRDVASTWLKRLPARRRGRRLQFAGRPQLAAHDVSDVAALEHVAQWDQSNVKSRCLPAADLVAHLCHSDDPLRAAAAWLALAHIADLPIDPASVGSVEWAAADEAARTFVFQRHVWSIVRPMFLEEVLDGAACLEGQVVLWSRQMEQVEAAVAKRVAEAASGPGPAPFGFMRINVESLAMGTMDTFHATSGEVNLTGVEQTLQVIADAIGHRDPRWVHTYQPRLFTLASEGAEDAWSWTYEQLQGGASNTRDEDRADTKWGSPRYTAAALRRGISARGENETAFSATSHYGKWRTCVPGFVRWLEGLAPNMQAVGYALAPL